jgi:anaerobic dimethyl sulfoxide reductase subunit B (iron-sulfur subunit)
VVAALSAVEQLAMGQYAFYFDSSSCSGCKACQAACKDKNNLPSGLLWRRVYELTGGAWTRAGEAWVSDVFAYNLSISCQHCQRPICVEVCPSRAMHKRPDGIVLVDQDKCLGCQYCSWACPYDALQFDAARGRMTKCDFCVDNLEVGLPPACIAACPLRALDYGELSELEAKYGAAAPVPPLPSADLTKPAIVIKPHQAAERARHVRVQIANREEVAP